MKVLKPLKTKPQPRPPLPTFDNLIRGHIKNQLYLQITAFKQGITTSLVPSSTTGRQGLAICYIHLLTKAYLNSSFEFRHEDKLCQSPKLQRVNYHLTVWPFLLNEGVCCLERQIQRAYRLLWIAFQLWKPLSYQSIGSIDWNPNVWLH